MAFISNNSIARAIYLATKDKSLAERSMVSKKVVEFLSRRRLFSRVRAILAELEKIVNQEERRTVVKVESAEKLTGAAEDHLVRFFKKRYSSKDVSLVQILNKKLIGGVRLEAGDEVIDLSLRNKITKLEAYLTKDHE